MKKYFVFVITIIFFAFSTSAFSQQDAACVNLAKQKGLEILNTAEYTHDGQFTAQKLTEGEELIVTRPFYKDQKYRIVVIGADNLPDISFEILNFEQDKVVFSNAEDGSFANTWEYECTSSEILHVKVKVPAVNATKENGCVAVIVGTHK